MLSASKPVVDQMVGEMADKISLASELLSTNNDAMRIFQAIEEGRGKASGWSVIRSLGMQAADVDLLLRRLKEYGVVDSTDAGLDGYYYLTKLGFALRNGLRVAV